MQRAEPSEEAIRDIMKDAYTLIEIMVVIVFVLALALLGGIVWVAIHFIGKYW